jgi:hypothetical protein
MKLLIDTNIFLEIILDQEKASDAKTLLTKADEHTFFISDYSLHSIGLLLFRQKLHDIFWQFVKDMMLNAGITAISLYTEDMEDVIDAARRFGLDFDDAYQYVVAGKYGLTIVSFDGDFDRTELGRKIPSQILGD